MKHDFTTYAEALVYFNKQVKQYGGSMKYRASEDYKVFGPIFRALMQTENVKPALRRKLKGTDLRPMWMVAQSQGII